MRLTSLDVFRGMAIAGMILVNKAGVADQVYPALAHADWNGWTFADLVFPFFLFIIGVAMAFSFAKYTEGDNKPTKQLYLRILRRSAILFILGLLLNGFWNYDFSTIRVMGVLQRISVAYLLASLAVLTLPKKGQWALAAVLLIGYWLIMSFVPVPGYGAGVLTREGNFGAYIDRLIIGAAHLYKGDNYNSLGDPEGLFSSLPAVVSVLIGYFTGEWLRKQPERSRTSINMLIAGLSCLVVGEVWNFWFPINKKLWTSSYVLFTAGIALILLAACYELIDVRKRREWGRPFEILGMNAILVFVASVLMIKTLVKTKIGAGEDAPTTYAWINEHLFQSWAGVLNGSLIFAILTVLLWLAVAYGLYRQRWFLKI
ncbi:Heparan-alpha-glucosaminide N-acetyltransferase [Crinalium epipsammum PCC 9333]|uniref:Heparan-alpha-glucosaminide N-acetyltransferase n=1 Tax=Crinalium epipsammum PCC 9333 TaxID=1173022 RepID=K9W1H5_9CYAN|nr:heparan-alpha-glucosaminide N-acetyltransferase domain-containing protein [Crinalium epipsammum]AFZ13649.1 Heparan-alpha-glucosaminide N-acetyltransferase [Crinalium epipsammum PCC 9333]